VFLNLGCGTELLAGFVNVDCRENLNADKVIDLSSFPWPFQDGSVEYILAQDVIEHFTIQQVPLFLNECARILNSEGRIQLRYPDFELLVKGYVMGGRNLPFINLHLMGGQDYPENQHRCILTASHLRQIMGTAGFRDVIFNPGTGFNKVITARI